MSIFKRGKYFYYLFYLNGKKYKGSCRTTDRNLAKAVENSVRGNVVRKTFELPIERNILFLTAWNDYVKNLNNSIGTIRGKISHSKHFLPIFGDKNLSSITIGDIKRYRLQRKLETISMDKNKRKRESEISFKTVNSEIHTLSNFFNYAIENEFLQVNPAVKIKKLNELKRIKTLSDGDIYRLIALIKSKPLKDLISFLIFTGCRKGEALELKWEDVDLQNGIIAIKATKTKEDRRIPVSEVLKELLLNIDRTSEYVFARNGKRIKHFYKSFYSACGKLGLKDFHIHDLRHVFASKMVMNGTSLYITGELLGHKTPAMTKRYSHLVPETLKKAVDDAWGKK
ncbi:MAG: tyrosine-type recombinase/integrase, partial [bacterium]